MTDELYEVKCPSGLTGLVRPMTVGDINAMSAKTGKKNTDQLGGLLRGIWVKTTDAGPYEGTDFVAVDKGIDRWEKILVGDRTFLVFEARRLTYGDDFYFTTTCNKCRSKIDWHLDLTKLEVRSFPQETLDAIAASSIVDAVIYRKLRRKKEKVGIKLVTGIDQRNVAQASEQGEGAASEAAVLSRLSYIEGAVSPGDRRAFVRSMHLADLEELRYEWEALDLYVQETIEIECQHCYSEQTVAIPADERFFSLRSAKPKQVK